jgi:hypothetical protein
MKTEAPAIAAKESDPLQPAPTITAAPVDHPKDFAFATRIQPVQATTQSALPAELASSAAVASASKKIATETFTDNQVVIPAATVTTPRMESSPLPVPAATPAASRPVQTALPEPPARSVTPLKDLSLQLTQPGNERVDVRVTQQGGEVHVSVHSSDNSLNVGLRQGLSDLQNRLEENGYRSEMWKPAAAGAPIAQSSPAQTSNSFTRGGDSQPQHQGAPQQDGGRRNPNQSNQPRWVEELRSSLTGDQPSGGFYGFGN